MGYRLLEDEVNYRIMIKYKNLTIIGTSHIAIESIREVERTIRENGPSVVALELDNERLLALMHEKHRKLRIRDIKKMGLKIFIINLIGAWAEKKIGEIINVKPGSEMKKAIDVCSELNIPIALIDQDVRITLKKLIKRFSWKEKFRLLKEVITGIFKKKKLLFDLRKVPEKKIIGFMVGKVKKDYPSVYLTLIEERNNFMGKHLKRLMETNESVVAVIGAGHEEGILGYLKENV